MIPAIRATGRLLQRATQGAVGHDLSPQYSTIIPARETVIVETGVKLDMTDTNYWAMVAPRSSLRKKGLMLGNQVGIIDNDYQGDISLLLFNFTNEDIVVHGGDRLAQLIFMPMILPTIVYGEEFNSTERGTKGFGSTG